MIARRSVLVFANSVLGAAMGYVAIILMARYMGAELVGARAYTLSIVMLGSLLTRLGLPVTHARRLAQGEDVGSSNGTFIFFKLILTGAFAGLGFFAIWIWLGLLNHSFQDTTDQALTIGILIVVAKSLRGIGLNTFRGLGYFLHREATLFVNTIVTTAATAWVAITYAHGQGRWLPFEGVAEWMANLSGSPADFPAALTALLGAYLLGELASLVFGLAQWAFLRIPIALPQKTVGREYIKQAIPLMLINIAALTMANMDQLFIGFWWSATEGGYYEVSHKLSRIVLILSASINIVLMPYFAKQFADDNHPGIRRATLQVERFLGLLVFPLAAFIFVFARPVIHILLADDFLPAIWVLRVLAIVVAIQSLTVPVRAKAIGKGESGLAAKTTWGALALNLVLDVLLIPQSLFGVPMAGWGPLGAAIGTLTASIWMAWQFRVRANEWTGHPLLSRHLQKQMFAVIIVALVAWSLPIALPRIYHLLAAGGMFLLLYATVLIAINELTKEDWRRLTAWKHD